MRKEILSLGLIVLSAFLSSLIAFYIIRLYAVRAKYQDEHEEDLQMNPKGKKHKRENDNKDYKKGNRTV